MARAALWGPLLLSTACTPSVRDRTWDARREGCPTVLYNHSQLVKDPAYATASIGVRQSFEAEVAKCWLNRRQPEKALAIVDAWQEPDEYLSVPVRARAYAQLARDAEAQKAFSFMASRGMATTEYFLEHPEFGPYVGQDWFMHAALAVWNRSKSESLERFARQLLARGHSELLSLSVATADTDRPPGDWVLWTGVVRETKLDRTRNRTVLVLEGVESKERLAMLDRKVTGVSKAWDGTAHPEYEETRTYEEELQPTGQNFVIEHEGLSERLVRMRNVSVLGRYAGRARGGAPIVKATSIMERVARTRTENAN